MSMTVVEAFYFLRQLSLYHFLNAHKVGISLIIRRNAISDVALAFLWIFVMESDVVKISLSFGLERWAFTSNQSSTLCHFGLPFLIQSLQWNLKYPTDCEKWCSMGRKLEEASRLARAIFYLDWLDVPRLLSQYFRSRKNWSVLELLSLIFPQRNGGKQFSLSDCQWLSPVMRLMLASGVTALKVHDKIPRKTFRLSRFLWRKPRAFALFAWHRLTSNDKFS